MEKPYEKLCELNVDIIKYISGNLKIMPRFVRASEIHCEGHKSDLVLSICKALGADMYISGSGGRGYMQLDSFKDNNIKVVFQKFCSPHYNQHNYSGFEPNMSIIDLLFNVSMDEAEGIVKNSGGFVDE